MVEGEIPIRQTERENEEQSGWPFDSTNDDNIENICTLLNEDYRYTIIEIWNMLDAMECSRAAVWQIVQDTLGYRKVSSQWVLRLFSEEHKKIV